MHKDVKNRDVKDGRKEGGRKGEREEGEWKGAEEGVWEGGSMGCHARVRRRTQTAKTQVVARPVSLPSYNANVWKAETRNP